MRRLNNELKKIHAMFKEDQNTEWKESWRYLKWICGFANAQGGRLFIGINDKGEVLGVKNAQKLMEEIRQ